MQDLSQKEKELIIKLNVEELSTTQIRLIKSMNALVAHILTSDDESEYFELSSQLFRKAAEVIKHSQFSESNTDISYGDQAVEFALDFLSETIENNKVRNIDN